MSKPMKANKVGVFPSPVADPNDSIATNRTTPIVAATSIPAVPATFRATPIETRRRRLVRVADTLRSEARDALREAVARKAQFADDLGRFAPAVDEAVALLARIDHVDASLHAAEALANYLSEIDEIVWSDTMRFLGVAHTQYEHAAAHDAAVVGKYPALSRLIDMRAASIVDGIARGRKAGEAAPKAVAASTPAAVVATKEGPSQAAAQGLPHE